MSLITLCQVKYYCLLNIIQAVAWGFSAYLIVVEYQRLLSEARYSHQLFWISSFVCQAAVVALTFTEYKG